MKFTRFLLLCTAGVLVSACGQVATKPQAPAEFSTVKVANPYLQSQVPVPEAVLARMAEAKTAKESGELVRVLEILDGVSTEYPNLSGPYLNAAIVHGLLEQPQEAEQKLRKAISVNPKNVFAYNQLAVLQTENGQFKDAEKSYQAALAIWPSYADAHRNLGILYDLYLNQPAKALNHFRTAKAQAEDEDKQLNNWIVEVERRVQQ